MDKVLYDEPVTLKTYLLESWKNVLVKTQNAKKKVAVQKDDKGVFVLYQTVPNKGMIEVTKD